MPRILVHIVSYNSINDIIRDIEKAISSYTTEIFKADIQLPISESLSDRHSVAVQRGPCRETIGANRKSRGGAPSEAQGISESLAKYSMTCKHIALARCCFLQVCGAIPSLESPFGELTLIHRGL